MKVAFLTVVYPGVEIYLDDFLGSLEIQTYSDFDIFVFNDGVSGLRKKLEEWNDSLSIIIEDVNFSPIKIREVGINRILETGEYGAIIFGDSDDYFSENRIEKTLEYLSNSDIVINDLDLIAHDKVIISKKYLSNRLENKQIVGYEFVKDKNLFGLSNTAISTSILDSANFPENVIALDWYFFSLLLHGGCTATFCSEAKTFYRQHENNTVGMYYYDINSLYRDIEVKIAHYGAFSEIDECCVDIYEQHLALKEAIDAEEVDLKLLYKHIIEKKIKFPLWWERKSI